MNIFEIEKYIDFQWETFTKYGTNLDAIEVQTSKAVEEQQSIEGHQGSGDYQYFLARIIFLGNLGVHAFFCGQQSIENHSKAYILSKNQQPSKTHDLCKLADECRSYSEDRSSFIFSDRLRAIITRFDPFNEVSRYPSQRRRPKNGGYVMFGPNDIYLLDYYIFKMREILPIRQGQWDLLKTGAPFGADRCPEDMKHLFLADNINFPSYTSPHWPYRNTI